MIKIKEAIIVEGRYDCNTVRQVVDAIVLETGGFRIYKDAEQLQLIRRIAKTRGIILLMDSDGAGFQIRSFLNGALPQDTIKQAFIPSIDGKERRKRQPSKEGTLGVEGMTPELIETVLRRAGATVLTEPETVATEPEITKADFYLWGINGTHNSAKRRQELLAALDLPRHMTAKSLLLFINAVSTKEELQLFFNALERVDKP